MQKRGRKAISIILFAASMFFLLDSGAALAGAFIGVTLPVSLSFGFSILFFIAGLMTLPSSEPQSQRNRLQISISDSTLERITEKSMRDQKAKRDAEHLIDQFNAGNDHPGLGKVGHIEGTPIFYLRGRQEGRVFYSRTGANSYNIVAITNKDYEKKAIHRILELYKS